MAIRDVLLTLTSYPNPTPVSVIDRAVSLASSFGAHIAAISCEVRIEVPGSFLSFGAAGAMAAGETHRSHDNAQALLAAFEAAAQKAGVLHETIHEKSLTYRVPERLVEYARLQARRSSSRARRCSTSAIPAISRSWWTCSAQMR